MFLQQCSRNSSLAGIHHNHWQSIRVKVFRKNGCSRYLLFQESERNRCFLPAAPAFRILIALGKWIPILIVPSVLGVIFDRPQQLGAIPDRLEELGTDRDRLYGEYDKVDFVQQILRFSGHRTLDGFHEN